jgi:hypothetical protein
LTACQFDFLFYQGATIRRLQMIDLSRVPLIPDDPTNPHHTTYAFPPEISLKVRKFFEKESLPTVTDVTLDSLATRLHFRHYLGGIPSITPNDNPVALQKAYEEIPPANDGETGKELIAIKEATEALLSLLDGANPRTQELLAASYTFHRPAPKGIKGRRFPAIEDVFLVLGCFRNSVAEDGYMKSLMVTGKGRRPGGADETPYMLLDDMRKVLACNGIDPVLLASHSAKKVSKAIEENLKHEGIDLAEISAVKIVRFVKILKISGVTEAYIKEWRSLRKGKTVQPIEIMLDNK